MKAREYRSEGCKMLMEDTRWEGSESKRQTGLHQGRAEVTPNQGCWGPGKEKGREGLRVVSSLMADTV